MHPRPGHRLRNLTILASVGLLTSCTLGPSDRPELAVYGGTNGPSQQEQVTEGPDVGPGGPGREGSFLGDWQTCGAEAPNGYLHECATLPVPVDHDGTVSGTLGLSVTKVRADGVAEDAPLLVFTGSAGLWGRGSDAGQTLGEWVQTLPSEIVSRFVFVGMDRRGTEDFASLRCAEPWLQDLATLPTQEAAAFVDLGRSVAYECGDTIGPAVNLYSTSAAADDLDVLRDALDQSALRLIGSGDGGTLAAQYVHRYPGRVIAAVIDSPTDHGISSLDRAAAAATAAEAVLDTFLDDCAARTNCPLSPDPAATLDRVTGQLADSDWAASGTLVWALLGGLSDESSWPELAEALSAFDRGREEPFFEFVDRGFTQQLSSWMVSTCNDTSERVTEQDLAAAMQEQQESAPHFGSFLTGLVGLCATWPSPERPLGLVSGAGSPGTLVLGTLGDLISPWSGVQGVSAQLSGAGLLGRSGTDHGVFPGGACAEGVVQGYLVAGQAPRTGLICPS